MKILKTKTGLVNELREMYALSLKEYAERAEVMEKVLEALREYEGKKITKRIAKVIQDAIPEYYVTYYKSFSWTKDIAIWGGNIHYQNRITFVVQYDREGSVSDNGYFYLDTFHKENGFVTKGLFETVTRYENLLAGNEIETFVDSTLILYPQLKRFGELSCSMPDSYALLERLHLKELDIVSLKYLEMKVTE